MSSPGGARRRYRVASPESAGAVKYPIIVRFSLDEAMWLRSLSVRLTGDQRKHVSVTDILREMVRRRMVSEARRQRTKQEQEQV